MWVSWMTPNKKKGGWPMPFGSSFPFGPRVTQNLFSGFAVNCDWFVQVVSYVLTRTMKDIFFIFKQGL